MTTDPTSTTFVGSHEKPENAYGQNGSSQPSSLLPGRSKSPIAKVSPPVVGLPASRGMDRQDHVGFVTKAGSPVPGHDPGGTIPKSLNRTPRR